MQIDKNVFIPGQKKSLACILILSCDRIHKYLTPASCLSNRGDYLDQPPAQLLLLLHLIWFRKDVMFRMLKIYFQTSRTELAAAPPPLVCKPFVHQQPLQILHHFSAGGERGLQWRPPSRGHPGQCGAGPLRPRGDVMGWRHTQHWTIGVGENRVQ